MVNFALAPLARTSSILAANNDPAGTTWMLVPLPVDHSDRNVTSNWSANIPIYAMVKSSQPTKVVGSERMRGEDDD